MSYEPTNWKTGDVVTSAKLNKIENGIAGAVGNMIVHETVTKDGNTTICTLDKTWKEINDVFMAGGGVYIMNNYTGSQDTGYIRRFITYVGSGEEPSGAYYIVRFQSKNTSASLEYYADSENGYPVYNE